MAVQSDSARLAAARDVLLEFLREHPERDIAAFERLCSERSTLARELRELWDDRGATSSDPSGSPTRATQASSPGELLARLASRGIERAGLRAGREIARGGMGAIIEAWDDDLNRQLAMKVMLARERGPTRDGALARFLEEAQITGQLEHPGVVPVHQLGLDERGRVFFTMRLVAGRDVRAIFELAWANAEQWNETRAVGVLLKVCEAMAYAHEKGVLHRDLKPANVMVGRFGEVYVMDWGVARVLGREDAHGLRPQVATVRSNEAAGPLVTRDGDVVGTPAFMPPEQARGEIERMSPQSDVYSVGAMLYHLLARHAPYADVARGTVDTLTRVFAHAPTPLSSSSHAPQSELVAVCERAMAREPSERYASMLAFADDLRAYLEGRVVRAYERGAWAELRKWVLRNRALAASAAAALAFLVLGLGGIAWSQSKRRSEVAQEAERTRAEAQVSERVTGFMTEIFRDQRPANARSREITARELLDQAAARIRSELGSDPQVRDRLLDTMAGAFMTLGSPQSAEPLLREALDSSRQRSGKTEASTLLLERKLGDLYLQWGRFDLAQRQYEALLAAHAALGAAGELGAFEARLGIGRAHLGALRGERAEIELRALFEDARRALGASHALVHDVELTLIHLCLNARRFGEAHALAEAALAAVLAGYSVGSRNETELRTVLGEIAIASSPLPEAERLIRERLARLECELSPDDPELFAVKQTLGHNLGLQQRDEEALAVFLELHEDRRRVLGPKQAETLAALVLVAACHLNTFDFERAEATAREALAGLRELSPEYRRDLSRVLLVLSTTYVELGRWKEAEPLARERLAGLSPDDPSRSHAQGLLERIEAALENEQE